MTVTTFCLVAIMTPPTSFLHNYINCLGSYPDLCSQSGSKKTRTGLKVAKALLRSQLLVDSHHLSVFVSHWIHFNYWQQGRLSTTPQKAEPELLLKTWNKCLFLSLVLCLGTISLQNEFETTETPSQCQSGMLQYVTFLNLMLFTCNYW